MALPQQPHTLILGTGLGACLLADSLLRANHQVTMVSPPQHLNPAVNDTAQPHNLESPFAHGSGGSTQLWHNGLILPPPSFWQKFPLPQAELEPYLHEAFTLLSPATLPQYHTAAAQLAAQHRALGIPPTLLAPPLYYPHQRRNLWHTLGLAGQVTHLQGTAQPLQKDKSGTVTSVTITLANGQTQVISADTIIVAAGGLNTPHLLQNLSPQAGKNYEDHPTGFIAEVTLPQQLYKLWNHQTPALHGALRQPMLITSGPHQVAFYLRPAYHLRSQTKRNQVQSVLSKLRNNPWHLPTYLQLLKHTDDVFDILSLKLGLNIQTNRFLLLFVAHQPTNRSQVETNQPPTRHWQLSPDYLNGLAAAAQTLAKKLGVKPTDFSLLSNWRQTLTSSAHHSGTARMGSSPASSVCNLQGQVWGTNNVYVACGSVLPYSSYLNTGLLIGALARRLGAHLTQQPPLPANQKHVDVVITGSNGFIAKTITPLLAKAGLTTCTLQQFQQRPNLQARWLLHLANIHANPTANQALLQNLITQNTHRVQGWLVPLTFSTLFNGTPNLQKPNCGFRPTTLQTYKAGKLLQEATILRALKHSTIRAALLPHLPSFTNAGGPFDIFLRQARQHGMVAFHPPAANHGPSLMSLEDLAAWLIPHLQNTPQAGVKRAILRNPTLTPSWASLLAPQTITTPTLTLPQRCIKFAQKAPRFAIEFSLSVLYYFGFLSIACRILWPQSQAPLQRRQNPNQFNGPATVDWGDKTLHQPRLGPLE